MKTVEMIVEIFRVLEPGGRYVAFSLHSLDEVRAYYVRCPDLAWRVRFYRVKSNRWNDKENVDRAVVYTMVVCDKFPLNNSSSSNSSAEEAQEAEYIPGTLSVDEYTALDRIANKARVRNQIESADLDVLIQCLDEALTRVMAKRNAIANHAEANHAEASTHLDDSSTI